MTTNWIKDKLDERFPFGVYTDIDTDVTDEMVELIKKIVSLAEQRTDKRWRETPPEIKTELPFSVTINGVPHVLTSISEQNFASLLRVGGEIDGKITLTFTQSDLLK